MIQINKKINAEAVGNLLCLEQKTKTSVSL